MGRQCLRIFLSRYVSFLPFYISGLRLFVDSLQEVRGTAVGFFMLGSVTGPAIGIYPFPYYLRQYKLLFPNGKITDRIKAPASAV